MSIIAHSHKPSIGTASKISKILNTEICVDGGTWREMGFSIGNYDRICDLHVQIIGRVRL